MHKMVNIILISLFLTTSVNAELKKENTILNLYMNGTEKDRDECIRVSCANNISEDEIERIVLLKEMTDLYASFISNNENDEKLFNFYQTDGRLKLRNRTEYSFSKYFTSPGFIYYHAIYLLLVVAFLLSLALIGIGFLFVPFAFISLAPIFLGLKGMVIVGLVELILTLFVIWSFFTYGRRKINIKLIDMKTLRYTLSFCAVLFSVRMLYQLFAGLILTPLLLEELILISSLCILFSILKENFKNSKS